MNDILEYKKYYATVHFSAEDEVFYGKIIGINDSVSFEGASVKELTSAFREAVDDYLETCKQLKKDPEKTYKGSFNVRIPEDLHRLAAYQAAKQSMSLNDFVRFALDFTLSKGPDVRTVKMIVFLVTVLTPALLPGFFMRSL